jgi:hypothetical protein
LLYRIRKRNSSNKTNRIPVAIFGYFLQFFANFVIFPESFVLAVLNKARPGDGPRGLALHS